MDALFFSNQSEFRQWLEDNHDTAEVLWVGYYKKATGRPSLTWAESVDEALCFGWIDGLRRTIDDQRYRIRFTPRRANSRWSDRNIERVTVMTRLGKMAPAGLRAFERRPGSSSPYPSDTDSVELSQAYEAELKANKKAWQFFNTLAPSAKKMSIGWVMSAKKEETRLRRLGILIESSAAGQKIPPLNIGRR